MAGRGGAWLGGEGHGWEGRAQRHCTIKKNNLEGFRKCMRRTAVCPTACMSDRKALTLLLPLHSHTRTVTLTAPRRAVEGSSLISILIY